ncbi:glycosyltransferase family 4 protein [bacterium]|nr:glycosyltransferase family 4 protein [bacterium]
MGKNIGFVSTRFSGTDGVTLEAGKWAEVLKKNGHTCFWFGGELDRSPQKSLLVPEAHFKHEQNVWISDNVWGKKSRAPAVTDMIHTIKSRIKQRLNEFIDRFGIDLLIAQNVLTIPMHIPLGVALTEIIAETRIPTIAHHHDFYWERTRFSIGAVGDYLRMAFPPNLHNIEHVVINSAAQEELALRTGISSVIIPNVLDFENPPVINGEKTVHLRQNIGLGPDDIMILQPTRIVQRKGIEHAIELVKELKDPRCKLVISHEAGDEGFEYAEWLKENARSQGVDLLFVNTYMNDHWHTGTEKQAQQLGDCFLLDLYPHADFITYPSLYEGFGNAFLEAIFFRKPMLINRYAIFVKDIEPQGFDLVVMDGFLTSKNVNQVKEILASSAHREKMVNHNFEIARRHYSYKVLQKKLNYLLDIFFGVEN